MATNVNQDDLVRDFLQRIIDHLPVALFCKDARNNFEFVFLNSTAEKMWGLPTLQAVGKTDFDLWPKEMAQFFRQKDLETMSTKQVVFIPEEPLTTEGGTLYLRTWKVPIFGEDGGPQWLLGIAQDITAEKLAAEERRFDENAADDMAVHAIQAIRALEKGDVLGTKALLAMIGRLAQASDDAFSIPRSFTKT